MRCYSGPFCILCIFKQASNCADKVGKQRRYPALIGKPHSSCCHCFDALHPEFKFSHIFPLGFVVLYFIVEGKILQFYFDVSCPEFKFSHISQWKDPTLLGKHSSLCLSHCLYQSFSITQNTYLRNPLMKSKQATTVDSYLTLSYTFT